MVNGMMYLVYARNWIARGLALGDGLFQQHCPLCWSVPKDTHIASSKKVMRSLQLHPTLQWVLMGEWMNHIYNYKWTIRLASSGPCMVHNGSSKAG